MLNVIVEFTQDVTFGYVLLSNVLLLIYIQCGFIVQLEQLQLILVFVQSSWDAIIGIVSTLSPTIRLVEFCYKLR